MRPRFEKQRDRLSQVKREEKKKKEKRQTIKFAFKVHHHLSYKPNNAGGTLFMKLPISITFAFFATITFANSLALSIHCDVYWMYENCNPTCSFRFDTPNSNCVAICALSFKASSNKRARTNHFWRERRSKCIELSNVSTVTALLANFWFELVSGFVLVSKQDVRSNRQILLKLSKKRKQKIDQCFVDHVFDDDLHFERHRMCMCVRVIESTRTKKIQAKRQKEDKKKVLK